jgi:hypothetical protein
MTNVAITLKRRPVLYYIETLGKKRRGPEPRPLLQATILFHLRGHLIRS